MLTLFLGLLVFLGVHSIQALLPEQRQSWQSGWGSGVYRGIYSLLSLAGLVLVVWGYDLARSEPVVIYSPPRALVHASFMLMWVSMILLVAAYWPGNQIRLRLRHPMTLGIKAWALAHLLANGMLADLMLFGTFLIWSVLVFRSARRRQAPASATGTGSAMATLLTVGVGTAVWYLFLWGGLHALLTGVHPLGSLGA
jgi:uncharacterized membrane protein